MPSCLCICLANNLDCVGFEVLTVVIMKSTVFWNVTPRSMLKVSRCFWGTYRLLLQGQRISRARKQHSACHLLSLWFLAYLILQPWRWRWCFPLKHQLTFSRLHGIISQKMVHFILGLSVKYGKLMVLQQHMYIQAM